MCAGPHVPATLGKLLSRRTTILCLIALLILATGATQPLPPLFQAQSATVAHGHVGPCFENLDLQCEVFPANAEAFQVIASPHSPRTGVSFVDDAPVGRRHNRPPPSA